MLVIAPGPQLLLHISRVWLHKGGLLRKTDAEFQAYVPYTQETREFPWPIISSQNIATRCDWMGQGHQAAESGSLVGLGLGKVIPSQSWGGAPLGHKTKSGRVCGSSSWKLELVTGMVNTACRAANIKHACMGTGHRRDTVKV